MARNLKSVPAFIAETGFTPGQVRWWIFNAKQNGLSKLGVIIRIGRRVYIDTDAFDRWIDAQREVAA